MDLCVFFFFSIYSEALGEGDTSEKIYLSPREANAETCGEERQETKYV